MFEYEDIGFRPIEERDLEKLRMLRNDQSTWIQLTSVWLINTLEQKSWYEEMSRNKKAQYYAIVKNEKLFPIIYEGDFLGVIRMDEIDFHNRSIRVGADILPGERGKGYGTKALQAILKYCFEHLGMHRVWLLTLEDNSIARKLYINAGLKEEGRMREHIWRNGKWKDYIVMSILEDEYRK